MQSLECESEGDAVKVQSLLGCHALISAHWAPWGIWALSVCPCVVRDIWCNVLWERSHFFLCLYLKPLYSLKQFSFFFLSFSPNSYPYPPLPFFLRYTPSFAKVGAVSLNIFLFYFDHLSHLHKQFCSSFCFFFFFFFYWCLSLWWIPLDFSLTHPHLPKCLWLKILT